MIIKRNLLSEIVALEKALQRKENQFDALFQEMNAAFAYHKMICNENGKPVDYRFLKVNKAFEKYTGLKADDILGRTVLEIFPDIESYWIEIYGKVATTGNPVHFENYISALDKYYSVNAYSPAKNYFAVTFHDITDQKRIISTLEKSEKRFRSIFDSASTGIALSTKDGFFTDVNERLCEMTGYSTNELLKMNFRDITHPDDLTISEMKISGLKKREYDTFQLEKRYIKKNGDIIWMDIFVSAVRNEQIEISYFIAITTDITEKKLAIEMLEESTQKLIEAKNRAEESDRLKSAFLANMSHEIRTPMNGIIGFSDLLSYEIDNSKKDHYIQIIKRSSKQLLEIVNDIIDISKIEVGNIELFLEEISLNMLLRDIYVFFENEAHLKGIILIRDLLPDKSTILTDGIKLKQILTNLVKNAIKFTDEGSVRFGVKLNENHAEFYIKDTGIGIERNSHELIFDRFSQAEVDRHRIRGGTGLGLAISRAYIERMGGKIWLESIPGEGSSFYFTLPLVSMT